MQFILSDRVPNCMLQALEKQNWFKFVWSTQEIVQKFKSHAIKVNGEYVQSYFPQISEKYGRE